MPMPDPSPPAPHPRTTTCPITGLWDVGGADWQAWVTDLALELEDEEVEINLTISTLLLKKDSYWLFSYVTTTAMGIREGSQFGDYTALGFHLLV